MFPLRLLPIDLGTTFQALRLQLIETEKLISEYSKDVGDAYNQFRPVEEVMDDVHAKPELQGRNRISSMTVENPYRESNTAEKQCN